MPTLTVYCPSCERPVEAAEQAGAFHYTAACPDCGMETDLVVFSGPVRVRRGQEGWNVSVLSPEEAESASWCGAPSSSEQPVAEPASLDGEEPTVE
jgi:hypothetical protein